MIPREYIKKGNWFKYKGYKYCQFQIERIEDGKVFYGYHFGNLVSGSPVREYIGYSISIDDLIEGDRFEPCKEGDTIFKWEYPEVKLSTNLVSIFNDAADDIVNQVIKKEAKEINP